MRYGIAAICGFHVMIIKMFFVRAAPDMSRAGVQKAIFQNTQNVRDYLVPPRLDSFLAHIHTSYMSDKNKPKLLVVTQKINKNDDVLGFFHAWVLEFAKRCEKVTVICLQKGEYSLPKNVRIFSLGKEDKKKISRVEYILKFYKYIWRERKNYDAVFVHMNPIYIALGGVFWKLWGKRVALWYTHKNVDLKLRIAEKFAGVIFTSAKESFRLTSEKVVVMGHGIEVAKFKNQESGIRNRELETKIVSVGRITPIKNLDILIRSCMLLKEKGVDFHAKIIGAPAVASDREYLEKLQKLVAEKKLEREVEFIGSVRNRDIARYYWESDFEVNLCPTGGIDKAVLEAMAAGAIPIVSNAAFRQYFGEHAGELIFEERNAGDLAEKIIAIAHSSRSKREEMKQYLGEKAKEFDTAKIIEKIIAKLS